MARRLCAFAFALVVLIAPAAAPWCEAACASHDAQQTSGHGQHHSPSQGPSNGGDGAALHAPHGCDHRHDEVTAVQQAGNSLPQPDLVETQVYSVEPDRRVTIAWRPSGPEHSPPGLLALTAQLRV